MQIFFLQFFFASFCIYVIKCYELKKEDTSKEDMFSLSGKGFQIDINKKIIKKDALDDIKNKLSLIIEGDIS